MADISPDTFVSLRVRVLEALSGTLPPDELAEVAEGLVAETDGVWVVRRGPIRILSVIGDLHGGTRGLYVENVKIAEDQRGSVAKSANRQPGTSPS